MQPTMLYLFPSLFLTLLVCAAPQAQDTSVHAVKAAFKAADIPAALKIEFNPKFLLDVSFDGKPVSVGVQLPRIDTVGPPVYSIKGEDSKEKICQYVIVVTDPDAPTPQTPTLAEFRHFLAGNFHVAGNGKLSNTTAAVTEWFRPTPPAGSSAHRYVVLVYKQSAAFNHQKLINSDTARESFSISSFADAVGLGDPLAGTFFLVAPDDEPDEA